MDLSYLALNMIITAEIIKLYHPDQTLTRDLTHFRRRDERNEVIWRWTQ